jgi:hypothetical protein
VIRKKSEQKPRNLFPEDWPKKPEKHRRIGLTESTAALKHDETPAADGDGFCVLRPEHDGGFRIPHADSFEF